MNRRMGKDREPLRDEDRTLSISNAIEILSADLRPKAESNFLAHLFVYVLPRWSTQVYSTLEDINFESYNPRLGELNFCYLPRQVGDAH